MKKVEELKGLLERLDNGEDPSKIKTEAKRFLSVVDPLDLATAEQQLVDEGLDPAELQKLSPLHLELLDDQTARMKAILPKKHIVATLIKEHETILIFLDDLDFVNQSIQKMNGFKPQQAEFRRLEHIAEQLVAIEPHRQREEEILLPEFERRGITGPPMREEHTELRKYEHKLLNLAHTVRKMDFCDFTAQLDEVVRSIVPLLRDHIFKENNILYPTALEVIDDTEVWLRLKEQCDQVGYCCFTPAD